MKLQATKMTPLIITSIDAMRAFIDSSQPCFLCILQSLLHSIAPAALDDCLKMAAGSLCYTHPKPEHRGQTGLLVAARDTVNLRSNDVINLTGTGRKLSFRVQGRCMTAPNGFSPSPEPHTRPNKSFTDQMPTYHCLYSNP